MEETLSPISGGMKKFVLLPHVGVVRLSWHPGVHQWVVLHSVSGERKALPPTLSEWSLEYKPDGLAFAFDLGDTPQVLEVDDFLRFRVFKKDQQGGESEYMLEYSVGAGQRIKSPLEHMQAEHNYGDCYLALGLGLAKDQLPFARFELPRDNCYIWWEVRAIVELIQVAPGAATSFIQKYIGAWNRALVMLQLSECLRSSQYERQRQAGEDRRRCLRFISVSSVGLVALLSKWASLMPNRGGLRSEAAVEKTKGLLLELCRVAAGEGGAFTLYLSDLGDRDELTDMPVGRQGSGSPSTPTSAWT